MVMESQLTTTKYGPRIALLCHPQGQAPVSIARHGSTDVSETSSCSGRIIVVLIDSIPLLEVVITITPLIITISMAVVILIIGALFQIFL